MDSTYSVSSFSGLVSSKRRLVWPPNSVARPKSRQMALAWPMWRCPLGSGGKRVCTRPSYLLVLRSSRMMSRMKLDGRDSAGALAAASVSGFEVLIGFAGALAGRCRRNPWDFKRNKHYNPSGKRIARGDDRTPERGVRGSAHASPDMCVGGIRFHLMARQVSPVTIGRLPQGGPRADFLIQRVLFCLGWYENIGVEDFFNLSGCGDSLPQNDG